MREYWRIVKKKGEYVFKYIEDGLVMKEISVPAFLIDNLIKAKLGVIR